MPVRDQRPLSGEEDAEERSAHAQTRRPRKSVPTTLTTSGPESGDVPDRQMGPERNSPLAGSAEVPNEAAMPSMSSRAAQRLSTRWRGPGTIGSQDRAERRTGTP